MKKEERYLEILSKLINVKHEKEVTDDLYRLINVDLENLFQDTLYHGSSGMISRLNQMIMDYENYFINPELIGKPVTYIRSYSVGQILHILVPIFKNNPPTSCLGDGVDLPVIMVNSDSLQLYVVTYDGVRIPLSVKDYIFVCRMSVEIGLSLYQVIRYTVLLVPMKADIAVIMDNRFHVGYNYFSSLIEKKWFYRTPGCNKRLLDEVTERGYHVVSDFSKGQVHSLHSDLVQEMLNDNKSRYYAFLERAELEIIRVKAFFNKELDGCREIKRFITEDTIQSEKDVSDTVKNIQSKNQARKNSMDKEKNEILSCMDKILDECGNINVIEKNIYATDVVVSKKVFECIMEGIKIAEEYGLKKERDACIEKLRKYGELKLYNDSVEEESSSELLKHVDEESDTVDILEKSYELDPDACYVMSMNSTSNTDKQFYIKLAAVFGNNDARYQYIKELYDERFADLSSRKTEKLKREGKVIIYICDTLIESDYKAGKCRKMKGVVLYCIGDYVNARKVLRGQKSKIASYCMARMYEDGLGGATSWTDAQKYYLNAGNFKDSRERLQSIKDQIEREEEEDYYDVDEVYSDNHGLNIFIVK